MNNEKYFIHDSSIVDGNVEIGKNTKVWQFCNLMNGCIIGDNCNIGQNVFIEGGVIVGNNVKIKNNVALYTGVICEDDVFLGPSCVFTNVINPRSFIERKNDFKNTVIKKGASIGANATILCGNTVGKYALVGAGAVVSKDVPDFALVVGVPAKQIGWVCKCGETLNVDLERTTCPKCSLEYKIVSNQLEQII